MLRIHFLDVGDGDCIVLEEHSGSQRSFGVIDSNRTKYRKSPARDKLIEIGADQLSFVCISHPDKDHYSGILDVLTHFNGKISAFGTYPMDRILQDKSLVEAYLKQIATIAERGDDPDFRDRHVEFMQIIQFAYQNLRDCWLDIAGDYNKIGFPGFPATEFYSVMPPLRAKGDFVKNLLEGDPERTQTIDKNDLSSAIVVRHAGKSVLLCADAPGEFWEEHVRYRQRARVDLSSSVVKLPHHGSKYDNTRKGLEGVFGTDNPVAIVSADGRRHPDIETFGLLDALGVRRYCTGAFRPAVRIKSISASLDVSTNLNYYLKVYADVLEEEQGSCCGDIVVEIDDLGAISVVPQYNTICACTNSLSELF
jgi:beta-lactamase superfamily II metal-dependent hydrolase